MVTLATLLPIHDAQAAACTSTGGNWGTAGTWAACGGTTPQPGDTVTITAGTVTLNTSATISGLTVSGGILAFGNSGTIRTLTVNGNISVATGATINVNNNTVTHVLNVSGNITNNGTFDLARDGNSLCSANFTGGGTHTIGGNSAGTTEFYNLTVANNLIINKTGAAITQTGTLNVTTDLTITAGTYNLANATTVGGATSISGTLGHTTTTGTRTFTGAVTISNTTGVWNETAAAAISFGGNLTNDNTFTSSTGTHTFTAASASILGDSAVTFGTGTVTANSLTIDKTAGAVQTNGTLTVNNNLAITKGTLNINATIGVTGTTTIDGILGTPGLISLINTAGTKTFTGNVTINNLGTLSETVAEPITYGGNVTIGSGGTLTENGVATMSFAGTFSNSGTYTSSTGTHTFTSASAKLLGSQPINFSTAAVTANTGLEIDSSATAPSVTTGGALTVGSSGAGSLVLTNGTLTANSTVALNNGSSLTVAAGATLNLTNTTTVGGSSSISGTVNHTTATGTRTFTNNVTINGGGLWNETAAPAFSFGGNLQNDGTLTANSGVHTFTGAAKTFSGANAITIPNTTISGTYQNNGTLTVGTALSGGGTLTNGATGTLNIGGTSGITGLTATAVGNLVNYTGTGQTLKVVAYHHLTLSGGAETFGAITTVAGDLTLSNTATATTGANLTVGGALNVGNGTTLTIGAFNLGVTGLTSVTGTLLANNATGTKTYTGGLTVSSGATYTGGNGAVNIAGNLTNSTTTLLFTSGSGTWTFNGGAAQQITGATTFQNLTLNNASGLTLNNDVTASTLLTLTSGKLITGSNTMIASANCTTGITRSAGSWVRGNLRMTIPATNPVTCDFHVGDANNYAPIRIVKSGTNTGTLTGSTNGTDPGSASVTDPTKNVNRTWTFSAGTLATGTTYTVRLQYCTAVASPDCGVNDVDAGANSANFIASQQVASVWTATTATTSANQTSAPNSGTFSAFGDFAVGERLVATCTSQASTNWSLPSTWTSCRGGIPLAGDNVVINHNVTQNVAATPALNNVDIGGSGTLTASGSNVLNISGAFSNAGIYTGATDTVNLSGSFTNSGTFTKGTSTWVFGGASAQTITGATAFQNLSFNNAAGVVMQNDVSAAGTLTLQSGVINTNGNILASLAANCTTGVVLGSGWVNGSLRLTFPAGTKTCNYYIGNASTYAPMALAMTSTAGGTLTGSTTANEDPLIATSGIDATKDANRYWSLFAAGDTLGGSSNSYSATFTYTAGDLDIGSTPASFIAGRYDTAWTLISSGVSTTGTGPYSTAVTALGTNLSSTTRYSVGEVTPTCNPPSDLTAAYPGVSFTCQCDNFTRGTLNPSTIFGGSWATSSVGTTAFTPQITTTGFMRLTSASGGISTASTMPGTFPAAGNIISAEFKHYAYGGSGADGIALTLSDSAVTPTPGAFGGSLGYAQKSPNGVNGSDCANAGPTGCPGFNGGWVGLAVDEFGNFSNDTEGRGLPDLVTTPNGPGQRADSVSVRGSGSGLNGYYYLGGSATLTPSIDSPLPNATRALGHSYRIIVDARNYTYDATTNPTGTKSATVSISRDTTGTGTSYGSPLIGPFDAYSVYSGQADVPDNWKLSFTASTGGSTNIHEVTGIKICAQAISPPAGYLIQVDNLTPSTCTTVPSGQPIITVKALRSNGTVATDYTATVTLAATLASGGGGGGAAATWTAYQANGTLGTTTGGAATYTFVAGDAGIAKFKLTDSTAQSVYITITQSGGGITTSLATPVVYSGGSFSVDTADALGSVPVAGRPHLMTITKANACGTDTTYSGSKTLDGWYTPVSADHPTGAVAPQICTTNVSGTCLPSAGSSCQTLSIAPPSLSAGSNLMPALNFSSGVASFCLVTSDVGKYSVSLRDDSNIAQPVIGSSTTLTVKPFALAAFDVKQGTTSNPGGTATSGSMFIPAGDTFTATVGGYLWNAGADSNLDGTPNASPTLAQLTASGAAPSFKWPTTLAAGTPYTPAAGVVGLLLPATSITGTCPTNTPYCFTNGVAGVSTPLGLTYSEVGSFTLTASTSNFLNTTGTNLTAYMFDSSGTYQPGGLVVGRFHPDHFEVISDSITPACSGGAFTYMGQPFGIDFTLVARNKLNGTTTNYDNNTRGYTLVGTPSLVAEDQLAANQGTDLKAARLSLTGTTNWVLGQYAVTSGVGHNNATFSKPTGLAATWTGTNGAGPYDTLTIGVKATDSDGTLITTPTRDMNATATGVCAGAGCDAKKVGSATQVRLGRLRLLNAYGSELLNVKVPVQAEYYDAGFWKVNTLDACTTIPNLRNDIAIGNYSNAPLGTNMGSAKIPSTSLTLNGGTASFTMTKPTTGVTGSLDIALNLGGGTADTSCVNWSPTVTTTSGASLSWLQFPWCSGKGDPNARVTFGSTKAPFIYLREQY